MSAFDRIAALAERPSEGPLLTLSGSRIVEMDRLLFEVLSSQNHIARRPANQSDTRRENSLR